MHNLHNLCQFAGQVQLCHGHPGPLEHFLLLGCPDLATGWDADTNQAPNEKRHFFPFLSLMRNPIGTPGWPLSLSIPCWEKTRLSFPESLSQCLILLVVVINPPEEGDRMLGSCGDRRCLFLELDCSDKHTSYFARHHVKKRG
jgi:hypothetical protein